MSITSSSIEEKQHNDRDLNAALNIRDKGRKDLMSVLGTNSDNKQKLIEASELSESMK